MRLLAPRVVGTVDRRRRRRPSRRSATARASHARLVAAADGKDSPLRQAAGIRTVEWRYPQTGIVTTVAHERPHAGVAVEHFLPAGPFAILPMTGNRSSIVWTERRGAGAARWWRSPMPSSPPSSRARFGDFLGAVEPVGPRWSYPLSLMQAERYIAPRGWRWSARRRM